MGKQAVHRLTIEDYQESSTLTLCLHFTPAQFFDMKAHSQRVLSAAAGPLTTAFYTAKQVGVRDNSIVYDYYTLPARWTVEAKM